MKKSKKKNEGVAAKPRRPGDEKGERKERSRKKIKKERKKRNAGSSPAPSAALQAAPARETTFRVWPAGWRSGSRTEEVEGVGKVVG